MEGANGHYDNQTNTIEISTALTKQLENASPEDKQAALLGVYETLLHETVHYGDYLDGSQTDGEVGADFANEVFNSINVEEGGETFIVTDVNIDNSKIDDAKKTIERKKEEGKSDIIPTVPFN